MKTLFIILCFITTIAKAQCDSLYFELNKKEVSCKNDDGIIEAINQHGTSPFVYTLFPDNVTNTTGFFDHLASGDYSVKITDSCGNFRTRFTTLSPAQDFTFSLSHYYFGCDSVGLTFTAYPNSLFHYSYGVVRLPQGDTIYSNNPSFSVKGCYTVWAFVKDECGRIVGKYQDIPPTNYGGAYVTDLQQWDRCGKFDLHIQSTGFTSPTFCLYKDTILIKCQKEPVFTNLDYGFYSVKAFDSCYTWEWGKWFLKPPDGVNVNIDDYDCSKFRVHIWSLDSGLYVYNLDTKDSFLLTGYPDKFGWLPYGNYVGKANASLAGCGYGGGDFYFAAKYPFSLAVSSGSTCSFGQSIVSVYTGDNSRPPFHYKVYYPNGAVVIDSIIYTRQAYLTMPYFTAGGISKITVQDDCGYKDSTSVELLSLQFYKATSVKNKCPIAIGVGGGGDLTAVCYYLHADLIPYTQIIKWNNVDTVIAPNSWQHIFGAWWFYWNDLQEGEYVVKYWSDGCSNTFLYDTIRVGNYIYPAQQAHIVQCSKNYVSFRDNITGGIAPYTYEVLHPVRLTYYDRDITIPTSDTIRSIAVRVVDGCGNSNTAIFPVTTVPLCYPLLVDTSATRGAVKEFIKVYPNPSNGSFVISISGIKKQHYKVIVEDAVGRVVYSDNFSLKIGLRLVDVLSNGVYWVRILNENTGRITDFRQINLNR